MNYKTKEKVNLTVGYIGMIIVVMAWIYPVFFLIVNANKTASEYSKGDKTEIIFGTAFIDNAIVRKHTVRVNIMEGDIIKFFSLKVLNLSTGIRTKL